jgi:hypothetical protein
VSSKNCVNLFFRSQTYVERTPTDEQNSQEDYDEVDHPPGNQFADFIQLLKSNNPFKFQNVKKKASKIKKSILKRFRSKKQPEADAEEQFEEFQNEEMIRAQLPDKNPDEIPEPGVVAMIKKDVLIMVKNVYAKILLEQLLGQPLEIEIDLGPILIEEITLDFEQLNLTAVEIDLDEQTQEVLVRVPRAPLEIYMKTKLKVGSRTLKGQIAGKFVLNPLTLKFKFEDDTKFKYFKPRVLFQMDDFSFEEHSVKIRIFFNYIPDELPNLLRKIFKNKIIKIIEDHIKTCFVNETSDVLNWVISTYYPANVDLLNDGSALNLSLVRPPQIKDDSLYFYMCGEFFLVDGEENSFENFQPSVVHPEMIIPTLPEDKNMVMGINPSMLRRTLEVLLTSQVISKPNYVPKVLLSYNKFKFDMNDATLRITEKFVEIKDMNMNCFKVKEGQNIEEMKPGYVHKLTVMVKVEKYSISEGKLTLQIVKVDPLEASEENLTYVFRKMINIFITQLLSQFLSGEYELYPFRLRNGLSFQDIEFIYGKGSMTLTTSLDLNVRKCGLYQEDRLLIV